ncbi:hypothetical protein scyTo_0006377 [Scyliorhinus torazame]|uniref:Uncharacterized protein n=1 Tax=Scyliorhinus torazame TaxID=75743 RepID=A0A401PHL7_SCYTO|nr:hypothetical protein [Scyliorhinus torazame]
MLPRRLRKCGARCRAGRCGRSRVPSLARAENGKVAAGAGVISSRWVCPRLLVAEGEIDWIGRTANDLKVF